MRGWAVREQARVFGEVAELYDEVRAGYPSGLVAAVVEYAGAPERLREFGVVEIGAGTGKATRGFAGLGVPITCVEPDPAMAAVLRDRLAAQPNVRVVTSRFEDWAPP